MNCKQVEKLLPLFIASELNQEQSAAITVHLAHCNDCQTEVKSFARSQNWLQNSAIPEFSAKEFSQLRAQVWAKIETAKAPRPWVFWQWQFGAATAAILILISAMAFLSHKTTSLQVEKLAPEQVATTSNKNERIAEIQPLKAENRRVGIRPKSVQIGSATKSGNFTATTAPSAEAQQIATNNFAANEPPTFPNIETLPDAVTEKSEASDAPEMLRIEIQTADPNIKIIWLTPKDTLAMRADAATDSQ